MNKKEFVSAVAGNAGYSQKEVKEVVESTLKSIQNALKKGEKVQLVGFGTFEVVKRAAREGRNPQTGKKIRIAEKKVPKFRPAKAFKEDVK